jgi:hypothetical protein
MAYESNRKYTARERSRLPDTAFLLPRHRKLPFKQMQGGRLQVSLSHVSNALARANQVEGVPAKELQAAIKRARDILEQQGGYQAAPPKPIRLAANTAGLSEKQAAAAADMLASFGISQEDIEVLPLGRRQCVIYWTGMEWDEITSPEDLNDMTTTRFKTNRSTRTRTRTQSKGVARSEAVMLASELSDLDARVVSVGGGKYAVEVQSEQDYPVRITSVKQLSMVANRGRRKMATRPSAEALAKELQSDFEGVRVVKDGTGYAVEFLDDAGWPVRLTSRDQLRMVANKGRKRAPKMASNGGLQEEILEGLTRGFWPQTPDVQYEPDAVKAAAEFYQATTKLNRGMTLAAFYRKLPTKKLEPEEFGYYLGMEANGEGVSYWDSYDGPDGVQLVLPDVEAHDTGDGELFFSWDPQRLNRMVWGG